jgi:hypothetical protein
VYVLYGRGFSMGSSTSGWTAKFCLIMYIYIHIYIIIIKIFTYHKMEEENQQEHKKYI